MAASPDERNLQTQLQTLEEKEQQTKAKLARLDQERAAAQATLEHLEERKQSTLKVLLGRLRKRYLSRLLGAKAIKVKAAKTSGVDQSTLGKITTIPKIASRWLNEIEIQPILKNYSYMRILYDTLSNEYFYEVIEPKLLPEEEELLEVLKEILVESLEMLPDASVPEKEKYLRRVVDNLLKEIGISLHPISKERVMYFVVRDFMRYGAIDVVMIDANVEDVSCDGFNVPFYIYHRKYGSIPSNLR